MNKLFKLILFFGIGITMAGKGFAQNINFQFRDSAALVNTFIDIPLKTTTTLTGRGIVSYSLQFSVNASYLQFQGVVTTGALAAGLGTPTVNTAVPGTIKIAAAGTSPLSGLGTFLFLRFKILQAGGTNITATGGADQNYFNEGDPVMVFQNSCLLNGIALPNIFVSPNTAILLKGETQQFTASGGAAPYTWSTANTTVSGISAAGLLTATQIGFTTVQAIDGNGYTGQSNSVEVRGYRLSIPDTTGLYNTEIKIPVRVTSLAGLNVLSGSFNITYNVAAFTNIQIETAGALLENVATPLVNLNTPGTIQVSFAGSTILAGSGVLFWIRGKLSNPAGSSTAFTFQNAFLNEDLQPIIKNGTVNYLAPAAISLTPNSGQLVYGDSLLLTVNGANATAPFTWTVSDTSLATIGANRYLKVKRSGQISISVTDANSATATTGNFQLYDASLKFGTCVKAVVGTFVEIPVLITALPAGQGILSMQGKIISSNPAQFSLTEIITTGTAAASFSANSSVVSNNLQFAMAGVTAIPGNSTLFKVRGFLSAGASPGAAQGISFQDIVINEGTPLPFIQNGQLTAAAVPVIYTFNGNGNWNIAANWLNNAIPPASLQGLDEIVIDPVVNGECILNIQQYLSCGTKCTVIAGKKLRIIANLNISQ
jgi:Bacterial Ig-like domain (group 2)